MRLDSAVLVFEELSLVPALPNSGVHDARPVAVGVIGVGNMGQHHVRVLSFLKDVQLVGVADINVERGLQLATKYQVRFFADYRDLLPHVEAVCVAVPTRLHYEVGMTCIRHGVHILMEKPIAASIAEAERLVSAATEANCILQVGHIERFNPAFLELQKVLQQEEILALEAHRLSPYSQRANDVSVVLDLMIHDIDLLLELTAAPVVQLTASGTHASGSGYLDYVTATLTFDNGVIASLTASKVTHRKVRRLTIHGKNSLTEADFLNNEIFIHRHLPGQPTGQVLYRQDEWVERVYTNNIEPLQAELEHFVNCVREGNQPSVGGEQALRALRLATRIEQIALHNQIWSVPRNGLEKSLVSP
ncbi:MAG: Gfo/Idh/MocA family oxidoreductase [Gloeomargarita sp. SKYG116]|nr:Gfo/Idh/MocA family oxidoreductase [Gloeomargarita sp. SKYG116]MCS7225479.1 Gfo/Idh/MocA family oxidoreductase [Gloeomargarita sp. SKYB31]MDW8400553.1 Gfo/Idh/MocA family oxidoreductase [Gloeomargarita sp. SKYGB_i_bin116]